ncbi:MAG: MFS transporter [Candidatus Freyarchaeota archaeon]|nr:MFS transporter [Candidatus Jordarchaeia archaeon]MBS7281225.1 MFS transporter [Candidatus Jordarchaeia archaeon]
MATKYEVYRERWIVLASFWAIFLLGGLLWVAFAPISSTVRQEFFPVFNETLITLLTAGIPLVFVIFAIPAGAIVDRKGWKFATSISAVLFVVVGFGRVFAPSLEILLMFQLMLGAAGAFVFSSVSKLVTNWFPLREGGFAQGLATLAQFVGIMLALILTPLLVASFGFRPSLLFYAAVAVVAAIIFFWKSKEKPPKPPEERAEIAAISMRERMSRIFRVRDFWILAFAFVISFGGYVGLTTFIERMIASNEQFFYKFFEFFVASNYPQLFQFLVTPEQEAFGGLIAGMITLGGILGCIIIPRISDRIGRRKPFLIIAAFTVIPTLFVLGTMSGNILLVAAFFNGFFLLAALPIALEVNVELKTIGPALAGLSVGLLLFFGQVGGIAVPLIMEILMKNTTSYLLSMVFYYTTTLAYTSIIGPLILLLTPPPPIPISGTFFGPIMFVILFTAIVLVTLFFLHETGRAHK